MDIPLVLERLRPGLDWGPYAQTNSTYLALASTWRDKSQPCPTFQEMSDCWAQIQAEQNAAPVLKSTDEQIADLKAQILKLQTGVNAAGAKVGLAPIDVTALEAAEASPAKLG